MLEGRIVLQGASNTLTRDEITEAYFGLRRPGGRHVVIWVNAVVAGVLLGGLYALFACGLSLMYGVMRIINLAHGDLAVLGAYLVLVLSTCPWASRHSWPCRSPCCSWPALATSSSAPCSSGA